MSSRIARRAMPHCQLCKIITHLTWRWLVCKKRVTQLDPMQISHFQISKIADNENSLTHNEDSHVLLKDNSNVLPGKTSMANTTLLGNTISSIDSQAIMAFNKK